MAMPIPEMPGAKQFGLGALEAHQVCSAPDAHVLTALQVSLLVLRSGRVLSRVLSSACCACRWGVRAVLCVLCLPCAVTVGCDRCAGVRLRPLCVGASSAAGAGASSAACGWCCFWCCLLVLLLPRLPLPGAASSSAAGAGASSAAGAGASSAAGAGASSAAGAASSSARWFCLRVLLLPPLPLPGAPSSSAAGAAASSGAGTSSIISIKRIYAFYAFYL
jgi:hypothetical protein